MACDLLSSWVGLVGVTEQEERVGKFIKLLILFGFLFVSTPASSQERFWWEEEAPPPSPIEETLERGEQGSHRARGREVPAVVNAPRPYDYLLMPALGALGGAAGVLGGAWIGGAGCDQGVNIGTDCFGDTLAGILIGAPVGSLGAMYLYGELRDLEGSGVGLVLGSVGGFLATLGIGALLQNEVALVALVALPPLGGTIGYMLGTPTPRAPATTLLDYSPGEGLSVGLPAVGVSVDPIREETRVMVPLLGGSF